MLRALLAASLLVLAAPAAGADARRGDAVFLIASDQLVDPNFHETVVLVAHAPKLAGPLGVIINRPTDIPVARAFPEIESLASTKDTLFEGGPVARRVLLFVYRSASKPADSGESVEVVDGVYLSWDAKLLRELLARPVPTEGLRVYAGHSAWAPGQLEAEVARGSWRSARPEARAIFDARPESLWREMSRRASLTPARSNLPQQSP